MGFSIWTLRRSPDDSIDYEAVYANLPNLKVLGVTAARRAAGSRAASGCEPPSRMQEIHTFEHTESSARFSRSRRGGHGAEPEPEPLKPKPKPKPKPRKAMQKTIDKAAASRCIGRIVRIPIDHWVDGLGREWDGTLRVADELCFIVCGTFYKRCELRAFKKGREPLRRKGTHHAERGGSRGSGVACGMRHGPKMRSRSHHPFFIGSLPARTLPDPRMDVEVVGSSLSPRCHLVFCLREVRNVKSSKKNFFFLPHLKIGVRWKPPPPPVGFSDAITLAF